MRITTCAAIPALTNHSLRHFMGSALSHKVCKILASGVYIPHGQGFLKNDVLKNYPKDQFSYSLFFFPRHIVKLLKVW